MYSHIVRHSTPVKTADWCCRSSLPFLPSAQSYWSTPSLLPWKCQSYCFIGTSSASYGGGRVGMSLALIQREKEARSGWELQDQEEDASSTSKSRSQFESSFCLLLIHPVTLILSSSVGSQRFLRRSFLTASDTHRRRTRVEYPRLFTQPLNTCLNHTRHTLSDP